MPRIRLSIPATRMIVLTHASNVCGTLLPVALLTGYASERCCRIHPEEAESHSSRRLLWISWGVTSLLFAVLLIFRISLNDTTNAFKAYRKEVIAGCEPLIAPHFNLTVELPLKAIIRGYSWTVVPITWKNRTTGEAKLKLKEMGSRYIFIILYLWLEKFFSRGDYHRRDY